MNFRHYISVLLSCLPTLTLAGNILLEPVKLNINAKQPIAVLKMTNEADTPTTYQLKLMRWQQKNGQDIYSDAREILVTPLIFKIAPHTIQLIRVALRIPLPQDNESTYRLFLNEVLPPVS